MNQRLKQAAQEARAWLFEHALPLWWERGYDSKARCFYERLDLEGRPIAGEPRRVRVQARQTFSFALAGRLGWTGPWRSATDAGVEVLLTRALRPDGGTRHLLAPDGSTLDHRRDLYDAAFVLLALSEAARALEQRSDLVAAADRLEGWIYWYWEHPEGGFEQGEVCPPPPRRQNPHMHLFEALLSLHETTSHPIHLKRAGSLARLFRDRMYDSAHGALPEFFDEAWRPMSDSIGRIVEPGHHFEWCWLLSRWRALGGESYCAEAERLRAHAEAHGVSPSGSIYDSISIGGQPMQQTSRLWPHTERLKANLARYEFDRDENALAAALQAHAMLRGFFDTPTKGLWYDRLLPDETFVREPSPASSLYHIVLAFSELIRVADATDTPNQDTRL